MVFPQGSVHGPLVLSVYVYIPFLQITRRSFSLKQIWEGLKWKFETDLI